jgi:hypothetical protein
MTRMEGWPIGMQLKIQLSLIWKRYMNILVYDSSDREIDETNTCDPRVDSIIGGNCLSTNFVRI